MTSESIDLSGKVALITGASKGIGREVALRFARAGASVAVNYFRSQSEAKEVAALAGPDSVALRADIADPSQVESLVDRTVEHFGRLDILVNNAALFAFNRFDGESYEEWQRGWRRTFDLNIFGAANAAWLARRAMLRTGGGKIINVASRAAFRGETEFADYGASKAALVNLTISLARACGKENIITSCVAPGFIETEMAQDEIEKHREAIVGQIPLGRVGTPDEVASVILFLASPLADYLNGAIIDVNGGSWFH